MPSMPEPRKIGLFGGTFDPVHLGHIHLATLARDALALDEVRFIPCRISPHKSGTTPTPPEDRAEMLRLALDGIPWAVTDDFEIRQPGPSFSWQTAEAMAAAFPGARLFWIMGGDQWDALPSWRHPDRLARLVEFIVLARGNSPKPREGYRLHVVDGEMPASATGIREAIANGVLPPDWLAPDVARWITAKRLYQR